MPQLSEYGSLTIDEIKEKLGKIFELTDSICREVGPKISQLGELRQEIQLIEHELYKRGELPKYEPPLNEISK
jgi:hypothetical protein